MEQFNPSTVYQEFIRLISLRDAADGNGWRIFMRRINALTHLMPSAKNDSHFARGTIFSTKSTRSILRFESCYFHHSPEAETPPEAILFVVLVHAGDKPDRPSEIEIEFSNPEEMSEDEEDLRDWIVEAFDEALGEFFSTSNNGERYYRFGARPEGEDGAIEYLRLLPRASIILEVSEPGGPIVSYKPISDLTRNCALVDCGQACVFAVRDNSAYPHQACYMSEGAIAQTALLFVGQSNGLRIRKLPDLSGLMP